MLFGRGNQHISGNGAISFIYTDRIYFVFLLPTIMLRSRAPVFPALEQCNVCVELCACMGVHNAICVCGKERRREEAGGLCILQCKDRLVPPRQRQVVKIQQYIVKTTHSSLFNTAGFLFSPPHGLHACSLERTIFIGGLSVICCWFRTLLGSSCCCQKINAIER